MKKFVSLLIVCLCCISAFGQISVAAIGRAVTQCDDFAFAKNMLTADGLIYNEAKSDKNCAKYYRPNAKYTFEALFVDIYKIKNSNKIEKCVITFSNADFLTNMWTYKYCNPYGLSIEPFQALYQDDRYAMGLNLLESGWYVATFFDFGRDVKFEHLNVSSAEGKKTMKKDEFAQKKAAEEELLKKIENDEYIDEVSGDAKYHVDYETLKNRLVEWRFNEYLHNDTTTWDKSLSPMSASIKISKDKSLELLDIGKEKSPQNVFLAKTLLECLIVDDVAFIKLPVLNRKENVSTKNYIAIGSNYRIITPLQSKLPIKLKVKRGEDGRLFVANGSSILKKFSEYHQQTAEEILKYLNLTVSSHPSFRDVGKNNFTVSLTRIIEETLIVRTGNYEEGFSVGYIFDFESSKFFKWEKHKVLER